jgi:alpha-L-fucosidase
MNYQILRLLIAGTLLLLTVPQMQAEEKQAGKKPEDRGPATPEIRKMTDGDFDTPEQQIGAMNLKRDWESCMILSPTPQHDGWSYRSNGKTRPLEECIRMLASIASGGGNLLLNFGPDQFGEFRPEEVAIAQGMGAWLKKYGAASGVRSLAG